MPRGRPKDRCRARPCARACCAGAGAKWHQRCQRRSCGGREGAKRMHGAKTPSSFMDPCRDNVWANVWPMRILVAYNTIYHSLNFQSIWSILMLKVLAVDCSPVVFVSIPNFGGQFLHFYTCQCCWIHNNYKQIPENPAPESAGGRALGGDWWSSLANVKIKMGRWRISNWYRVKTS